MATQGTMLPESLHDGHQVTDHIDFPRWLLHVGAFPFFNQRSLKPFRKGNQVKVSK